MKTSTDRDLLRHALATLAYRAAKALRDPPADFDSFRIGATSRTPVEILGHMADLMAWGLSMAEAIAEPRTDISSFAPKITTMNIPVAKIGAVVGPGGKMIRSIIEETGVKIDIEDDGTIKIASSSGEAAQKAIELIKELTATAEIGKNYMGKVKKVVDFGAFVEILPRTEGLLHISEISEEHIQDIRTEVRMGDKILVKVLNVDDQGKIRLSRRAVLQEEGGG